MDGDRYRHFGLLIGTRTGGNRLFLFYIYLSILITCFSVRTAAEHLLALTVLVSPVANKIFCMFSYVRSVSPKARFCYSHCNFFVISFS